MNGLRPIRIRGARVHNLKNISLTLPAGKFIVVTGVSGSGKSSLVFDTLYAEGRRRYVESLSTYARQFLGQLEKPDLDEIDGLSPAIAIEQRATHRNPRSTVGTVTEIYDHLRLLWARVGEPYCPDCRIPVSSATPTDITDRLLELGEGARVTILAPIAEGRKGEFRKEISSLKRNGYVRARIDGKMVDLDSVDSLARTRKHTIAVVVDRLRVSARSSSRLTDSIETALSAGGGKVIIADENGSDRLFSETAICTRCGHGVPDLEPNRFSFNSPYGACMECDGLGIRREIRPDLVVPDPSLSVKEGALKPWGENALGKWYGKALLPIAAREGFSLEKPFGSLPKRARRIILYGEETEVDLSVSTVRFRGSVRWRYEGVIPNLERRYRETRSHHIREWIETFMADSPCPSCNGERLNPDSRHVRVDNERLPEFTSRSISSALDRIDSMRFDASRSEIASRIIREIRERLGFLNDVGLPYLTLDRAAGTLSGGEAERIRLATQLGSRLQGVLYCLDEPSIGLHPADTEKLLATLHGLRDLGNTVVVVEHDLDTILSADHIVDLGPGAGRHGGRITAEGTAEEIGKNDESLTGNYISGKKRIEHGNTERIPRGFLTIRGVSTNNLKDLDATFHIGCLNLVSGVSGSGKSSLVVDTLLPALMRGLGLKSDPPGPYRSLEGAEKIAKVVDIDQAPIGRTPRSNPATYSGVFTEIREIFAMTPEAKVRGYGPGRFSFNVKGGRCEVCGGGGVKVVEMHFLPDLYVACEACGGRRYNRETLEVSFKGRNIHEVLSMTVLEALDFFGKIPKVRRKLEMLSDVGLGYIHLGQGAPTLSGGEAQRLKLASELSRAGGDTVYILDEPTTGLHLEDVRVLLGVLDRLVERDDTVIVIEHHPEVIAHADRIIDLGPGGGDEGGRIVAAGTPMEIAACEASLTGRAIRRALGEG